jgi:endonuclease YncB( thermonuclease family)
MSRRLSAIFLLLGAILLATPSFAASAVVRDGDSIEIGDVTYHLDGVDAPEFDQICIDDHADPWSCGVEARDQLVKLINGRAVLCDDLGLDKSKRRHIGVCTAEGDPVSLNQQLAKQGLALSAEPALKIHASDEAANARTDSRGLWKGCFVSPQDFRVGKKDAPLMGGACRADRDKEIRAVLFPEELAQPPSCPIKAKLAARARFTGNVGIYHLQGCPSYAGLKGPDRWFCSEEDARAEGFRRAFNCRAPKSAAK